MRKNEAEIREMFSEKISRTGGNESRDTKVVQLFEAFTGEDPKKAVKLLYEVKENKPEGWAKATVDRITDKVSQNIPIELVLDSPEYQQIFKDQMFALSQKLPSKEFDHLCRRFVEKEVSGYPGNLPWLRVAMTKYDIDQTKEILRTRITPIREGRASEEDIEFFMELLHVYRSDNRPKGMLPFIQEVVVQLFNKRDPVFFNIAGSFWQKEIYPDLYRDRKFGTDEQLSEAGYFQWLDENMHEPALFTDEHFDRDWVADLWWRGLCAAEKGGTPHEQLWVLLKNRFKEDFTQDMRFEHQKYERVWIWLKDEAHRKYIDEVNQLIWNHLAPPLGETAVPSALNTTKSDLPVANPDWTKTPVGWKEDSLKDFHKPACWEQFDRGVRSANHFVILSGPPGTGKTWLPILYAAWQRGHSGTLKEKDKIRKTLEDEGILKIIPCRPNWTSPRPLVGGRSFDGKWSKGLAEDFIRRAHKYPHQPHFLVVDEMNLAHPEHYLSDFISAMETGSAIREDDGSNEDDQGKALPWAKNLVIVGTVNVDETTQRLSPRLKSRAWVIKVRQDWRVVVTQEAGDRKKIAKHLKALDDAVKKAGLGFGFRDLDHVQQYACANNGLSEDHMWEAIEQKLLPKLRGTKEELEGPISEVLSCLPDNGLKTKVEALLERLQRDEYLAGL